MNMFLLANNGPNFTSDYTRLAVGYSFRRYFFFFRKGEKKIIFSSMTIATYFFYFENIVRTCMVGFALSSMNAFVVCMCVCVGPLYVAANIWIRL